MSAPASEFVRLKDGSTGTIRPIAPEDGPALVATFEQLGPESRYRRFLQPMSHLTERALTFLLDVDHRDREALVARDAATGEPLAVARYARSSDDAATAEFAVAVVDHAQGKGLGSAILLRLADRARAQGITRFTALVLTENRPMFVLLGELGTTTARPAGGGTMEVMVELPAGEGIGAGLHGWLRAAATEEVSFASGVSRQTRRPAGPPPREPS